MMNIERIITPLYAANVWLIWDSETRQTLVIDPGDQAPECLRIIDSHGLQPRLLIATHGHPDHIAAATDLQTRYRIPFAIHQAEQELLPVMADFALMLGFANFKIPVVNLSLNDNDALDILPFTVRVIHSPGHTPGSICLQIGRDLFSGDTLFKGSVGRTDLPGGSHVQLLSSLDKIVQQDIEHIFPGHGSPTTLAHELTHNSFLRKQATI